MKGIIMTLLADMVEQQLGLEEWNQVLAEAGVDGAYTSSALYPDSELLTLVGLISERNQIAINDLVFAFGEFMFPQFAERYPYLTDTRSDFLDFLESIHDVIHAEVNKLHPGAITPTLTHERLSDTQLRLRYQSDRKMCSLAEGLISGAARHYQSTYHLEHSPCMHAGSDHCGLIVTVT